MGSNLGFLKEKPKERHLDSEKEKQMDSGLGLHSNSQKVKHSDLYLDLLKEKLKPMGSSLDLYLEKQKAKHLDS